VEAHLIQNGQEKTKSENDPSIPKEYMSTQEQFLQNIPKFKRILVPYDASQISDKALRYAIYLSKRT
jgi:hypothetical protein